MRLWPYFYKGFIRAYEPAVRVLGVLKTHQEPAENLGDFFRSALPALESPEATAPSPWALAMDARY